MQSICIICGQSSFISHLGSLLKCQKCSLIVAKEAFETIDFATLYSGDYFFGIEYRDYIAEKELLSKGFSARLGAIEKLKRGGKLLEIGCAYGFFLEIARRSFEVAGIDISKDATDYARNVLKLPAIRGDFLIHPFPQRTYDVVCLWDTIEHLQRPDLYLEKIARLLRPGGILCLTTGNIDRLLPRIQGARWRMIHPPTHLYYFSFHTLRRLLNKYGFMVYSEKYPGSWRSLPHILHGLGMKSAFFANLEKKTRKISLLGSVSLYYNAFDIMYLIAQKENSQFSHGS